MAPASARTSAARAEADARRLATFVEGLADYAVLLLDSDGTIRTANEGATAILGHAAGELVGQPMSCLHLPQDAADGAPDRLLQQARTGRFEEFGLRLRRDGSRFTADVIVTPVNDAHGRLAGFGMILRDISALQASESRLRSLVDTVLDTLVDGLIIIDRQGRMQLYNRACERLFGYSAAEALGHNVKMLMPPDMAHQHDTFLDNYERTGVRKIIGISREVTGQRRDGSTFPMHLAVGEISHDGQPIYVGIIRDLSERNRTEEQLRQAQKMEAVGQLTGGIAHDFNNILMVIMANTDALLERDRLPRGVRDRLDQVGRAAQRAADLTRQLLAFSRKQPLRPQPTDLNGLVEGTSRLLRRTLGENIDIRFRPASGLWSTSVDRAQLESALVNLCLNARDAMPGGGRLTIETDNVALDEAYVAGHPDAVPGAYVLLSVSDEGTGMPPGVLARVFEPFFTTKEVGKGTGLGLSMVYGFVRQSNGHIAIDSVPGEGTMVRLYLPRGEAAGAAPRQRREAAPPAGSGRILVVEDDPQVRAGVVEQLSSLGYRVTEATDGEAGLAAFVEARRPFDLVVTDVVMPGAIGGRALAEEVRRRSPATPVLLMSGYTEDAALPPGALGPGLHLIEKPVRKRDLARLVRTILDGSR